MRVVNGQLVDFKSYLVHLVRNNQLENALKELDSNAPAKIITNEYTKLRSNLISLHSNLFPPVATAKFSPENYNFPPEIIQ
tara:strand:+ start:301 stop:543 length:243 start_codon:yes stop_codon:yes gene_type:complete